MGTDEWDAVEKRLLDGRDVYGGVSLLAESGDYDYPQAPFTRVPPTISPDDPHAEKKRETQALWVELSAKGKAVQYTAIVEDEDHTQPLDTVACVGGVCVV